MKFRKASTVIFAVLVILIVGLFLSQNDLLNLIQYDTKKENLVSNANIDTFKLPVSLNNKNVDNIYLTYNFSGELRELKDEDSGSQIILDTNESDLPEFLIDKETQFYNVDSNNKISPGEMDGLKEGRRVSISATYDLRDKSWKTRMVYILNF